MKSGSALPRFIKGLHAPFDADRSVFYWISFEILRDHSDAKVEQPARLPCGHDDLTCPTCEKPTDLLGRRDEDPPNPVAGGMAIGMTMPLHGRRALDEYDLR